MATSSIPEPSIPDLDRQLNQARAALGDSVEALRAHVRQEFDWRLQLQRHPDTAAAGALAVGLIAGRALAGLMRPGR